MIMLQERQRRTDGTLRSGGCAVWLTRNAAVGTLPGVAFLLHAFEEFLIVPAKSSLPLRRRRAGYALAAVLAPVLAVVLSILRGQLNLTAEVLAVPVAVIAVAL